MQLWIINKHTRACFGPYDRMSDAMQEVNDDPQPKDWTLVKTIPWPKKEAKS